MSRETIWDFSDEEVYDELSRVSVMATQNYSEEMRAMALIAEALRRIMKHLEMTIEPEEGERLRTIFAKH